jgi:hypothetical protein
MIKSRTFFVVAILSWPLVANMPGPPPIDPVYECSNKKIGETCRYTDNWRYSEGTCQLINGKLQCGKKGKEQLDVTAKTEIMSHQEAVTPELEAVGCAGAGIPSTLSFTSIILGLLLLIRKRAK